MLITSVNQAIIPAFSRAANDKQERALLGRLATYYYLAVAALSLLVASTAKDLIDLLTPASYHAAGQLVPFIALGIAAMGFFLIQCTCLPCPPVITAPNPFSPVAAPAYFVDLNLLQDPS